jgi:hypothetical protein
VAPLVRVAQSSVPSLMTYRQHERFQRPHNQAPREVELKLAVPDTSVDALEAYLRARAVEAEKPPRRHEFRPPDTSARLELEYFQSYRAPTVPSLDPSPPSAQHPGRGS